MCMFVCVHLGTDSQGGGDCVLVCYIILLLHWLNQWLFKTAKLFFGRTCFILQASHESEYHHQAF